MHLLMSGKDDRESAKQLDWARKTLTEAGFDAPAGHVPGDAERAIARAIPEQAIDILVMSAYSHSPLRNLFLGSRTSELLRSTGIAALLLR